MVATETPEQLRQKQWRNMFEIINTTVRESNTIQLLNNLHQSFSDILKTIEHKQEEFKLKGTIADTLKKLGDQWDKLDYSDRDNIIQYLDAINDKLD